MKTQNKSKPLFLFIILSFSLFGLAACDKQTETIENKKSVSITTEQKVTIQKDKHSDNIIVENKSYLFDVTNHSKDEFQALLTRAEEVYETQSEDFADLKIIMVIHGPDIEWFTQQNYQQNRNLIDLAARLDTYNVIDLKVCERTMSNRNVDRKDIPSFIESVPYGPTEIKDRLQEGYINF